MNTVINSYLDNPDNKELELRFNLEDAELWKTAYNAILEESESGETSSSIVAVVMGDRRTGNRRKEIFFQNGGKTESFGIKKRGRMWFSPQRFYKIVESIEEPTDPFGINSAKLLRFRFRSSLVSTDFPNWRFDFTVVKEIGPSEMNQVKKIKQSMLPGKSVDIKKYLDEANLSEPGVKVELEVEYISDNKELSAEKIQADIKSIVKRVQQILGRDVGDFSEYHDMVFELANYMLAKTGDDRLIGQYRRKRGHKELHNNVISLSKSDYFQTVLPNIDQYYLSDKADGLRCFLVFNSKDHAVAVLTGNELLTGDEIKAKIGKPSKPGITILDAELVTTGTGKSMSHKFYVFDIVAWAGSNVSSQEFQEREKLISEAIKGLGPAVTAKFLVRLTQKTYKKQIKDLLSKPRPYKIDGLIFTPAGFDAKYRKKFNTRNHYFDMTVYKYKDAKENTIDFLVMKVPNSLLGKKPYVAEPKHDLYFLFCGVNYYNHQTLNLGYVDKYREIMEDINTRGNYFPIQFAPSLHPMAYVYQHPKNHSIKDINMQISEFEFDFGAKNKYNDPTQGFWKLNRIREDKSVGIKQGTSFGNDFKVAESIFMQIMNPLTESDLLSDASEYGNEGYFAKSKTEEYRALTKLNNFASAQVIRQIEKTEWIVDLGAGKGQNLSIYNCFGIHNGVMVEVDKGAITELIINRKYWLGKNNTCLYAPKPDRNMRVSGMIADLTEPHFQTTKRLENLGTPIGRVDAVVSDLVIHYLVSDAKSLQNILNLVDDVLKPGGKFIFTTFNGAKIFELLKKTKSGKTYDFGPMGNADDAKRHKFSIKKMYPDSVNTMKTGLKIGVGHHFAAGQYYEEYLLDIDDIVNKFKAAGYKVHQNGSFSDWLDKFRSFNKVFAKKLTKEDIAYSSLYQYVSLVKK